MPLLQKAETKKDAKWVPIKHSMKKITSRDVYVLGHPDVKMPAVVSSSTIKGVKARLVKLKKVTNAGPPKTDYQEKDLEVINEWEFDKDNQTKPIYFSNPEQVDSDFWVEMKNESTSSDAAVNALVHGMIRSKNI